MSYIHYFGSTVLGIMILSMMTPSRSLPLTESGMQNECRNIEVEHLESVSGGMEIMLRVAIKSLCNESTSECKNAHFPLGQKVLCYVYDRYREYSNQLLTTSPDDPLFAKYSANQYIAWKNLNSTCQWVQYKTDDSLPDCTLMEIGKSCVNYRIYEHFNETRTLLDDHIRQVHQESGSDVVSLSIPDWLQINLHPEPKSVSSVILKATDCTTNVNGEFIC